MKYALVNNEKVEAVKGQVGICPVCGSAVIAKCGNCKINHWAHKTKQNCDVWWENETIWHRTWKNHFATEWQEKVFTDNLTGEKHIADICTDNNLVIEFQHSAIKPEEKISRENFYSQNNRQLIWVVDATMHFDKIQYLKTIFVKDNEYKNFISHRINDFNNDKILSKIFTKQWLASIAPVFLDFGEFNYLLCIFPEKITNKLSLMYISKENFVQKIKNGIPFVNSLKEKQNKIFTQSIDRFLNIKHKHLKILRQATKETLEKNLKIGDIYNVLDYNEKYKNLEFFVIKIDEYSNENNNFDIYCLMEQNNLLIPAILSLEYNDYKNLKEKLECLNINFPEEIFIFTIIPANANSKNYSSEFRPEQIEQNVNLKKFLSKIKKYY